MVFFLKNLKFHRKIPQISTFFKLSFDNQIINTSLHFKNQNLYSFIRKVKNFMLQFLIHYKNQFRYEFNPYCSLWRIEMKIGRFTWMPLQKEINVAGEPKRHVIQYFSNLDEAKTFAKEKQIIVKE